MTGCDKVAASGSWAPYKELSTNLGFTRETDGATAAFAMRKE